MLSKTFRIALQSTCLLGAMGLLLGSSLPQSDISAAVATGPTVVVRAFASDVDGDVLTYSWKSTDGIVKNVNARATTWTLPAGPGLHFLYVEVSDGKGGHIERRIAVNTDPIGTPLPSFPPVDIVAPAKVDDSESFSRIIYEIGDDSRRYYMPDALVQVQDTVNGGGTVYQATTDLKGQFITPKLPPGNYTLSYSGLLGTNTTITDPNPLPIPQPVGTTYDGNDPYSSVDTSGLYPILSPTQEFFGHVALADGSPCGTRSKFFNIESTATVTILGANQQVLAGPQRINAFGDYGLNATLTEDASGAAEVILRVSCEGAAIVEDHATVFMKPAGSMNPAIVRNFILPNHAPTISNMTAVLATNQVGLFLPPPRGLPSDRVAAPDAFLSFKGLDTRRGACQYYKAMGVLEDCDASGTPIGKQMRFDDWKRVHKMAPYNAGNDEYSALYINKVDLNLTRNHHGTVIDANHVAAYVCNHLGPTDALGRPVEDQPAVDQAIDNAANGKNLVACVAFDYSVTPGVNNDQPFTKYVTFGPSGELLLSVNLDGRAEKFMPGVCVACHGGEKYDTRFPEDGSGSADIGAHFLPYDLGNFEFSTKAGLTEADQQASLRKLNEMVVIGSNPTAPAVDLIKGWYANSINDAPNKQYLPTTWQTQSDADKDFYHRVVAPVCRTCHINAGPEYNFDDYNAYLNSVWNYPSVCGKGSLQRAHTMPNSLVTFNRFWNSMGTANDLPATFVNAFNNPNLFEYINYPDACKKGFKPPGNFHSAERFDIDGSRRSALIWENNGTYQAWLVKPDGATKSSTAIVATPSDGVLVGSKDFDGDGKADLLLQNGDVYTVRLMNGGTVKGEQQIADFTGLGTTFAGLGDFDGDGKTDIVWKTGDVYSVWLMNGFTPVTKRNIANLTGLGYTLVGVADFTRGNMSDLLWRRGDVYSIWLMNGLTHVATKQIANFTGTGWSFAGLGTNRGIDTAVVWRNGAKYSMWSIGYDLRPGTKKTVANMTTTGLELAGLEDLDGDGNVDLIWRKGDVYSRWLMDSSFTRLNGKTIANMTNTGLQLVP